MDYKMLSKGELQNILDIIQFAIVCKTEADIKQMLEKTKKLVGGEYGICGLGIFGEQGLVEAKTIINASYPEEWLRMYEAEKFYFSDPIVKYHYKFFETQLWADTYKRNRSKDTSKFIYDANCFGLRHGISSGMKTNNDLASIVTFSSRNKCFAVHQKAIMDILVFHFHQAIVRKYKESNAGKAPPLTEREREVLDWAKEGKTNWEISMILHISERTVKFHLHNIQGKLDAVSKAHAVAIMMEQDMLR